MSEKNIAINDEVARILGMDTSKKGSFQSFSGVDMQAIMYLPSLTASTPYGQRNKKFKIFADLQTMSISSTRSVTPVRTLGRSSPKGYCRGARTIAGTMVFASINQDAFKDVYDIAMQENTLAASSSLISDQLPPFSIVITAANETGGAAMHVVHGITLVNYGTTYSIDDLYTEQTYSYVATDVMPLMNLTPSQARAAADPYSDNIILRTISSKIFDTLKVAYGSVQNIYDSITKVQNIDKNNSYYQ